MGACDCEVARTIRKRPMISQKLTRVKELRDATGSTTANGPLANLEEAAEAIGYKLCSNLALESPKGDTIPLIGQEMRWIKRKVDEAARDKLLVKLKERCGEGKEQKASYRKDIAGKIGHDQDLDFDACTALQGRGKKKVGKKKKKRERLPPEGSVAEAMVEYLWGPLDDEEMRWWEVLVTGAVRTGERLHSAGIKFKGTNEVIPLECQLCGGRTKEDIDHILWRCPHDDMEDERDKFKRILGNIAANVPNADERRILNDLELWPMCLRSHGLMPRPDEGHEDKVSIAQDITTGHPMPLLGAKAWGWLDAKLMPFLVDSIYTDGACSNPGSLRHARAGYGVYYYDGCP